jgi:hypothetical protein
MLERKIWLRVYNVYHDCKITGLRGAFGESNYELQVIGERELFD